MNACWGDVFNPEFSFRSNNGMLACLTQSQVQDFFRMNQSTMELAPSPLLAFFMPKGGPRSSETFYAVIHRTDAFVARFEKP